MKTDVPQEAMKSAPAVIVTGWAYLNGMTLEKWVALATLAYIALQAAHLVWKWFREWRKK